MADIKLTVNYNDVKQAKVSLESLEKTAKNINNTKININTDNSSMNKLNTGVKTYNNSVKEAAKSTMTFGDQLKEAYKKFAIWSVATISWYQVVNAVKDMIDQVKILDDSLVELQKVTDLEGESLDKFTDKAFEAADTVAKTGSEMIDAATEFAKSGYDEDQALQLGQIALMYTNIADEELSAGDAASFIIAQMKAFNIEAEDSLHIVDALNEVSNNYAVSSADLSGAIGKVSSTMAVSNTTYEQTLGLITAITEVTRNADKAANSLKTISQRLRGVGEDGEDATEYVGKLQDEFDKLDINAQIVKSDGSMESTYNILTALAEKWGDLTDAQRQSIGELAAGKNRITEFNALMENFEVAISATETAMNSAGSATKENEKYLNSIQGKLNQLSSAWQNFDRQTIDSNWMKGIVSSGTTLIKILGNAQNALTLLLGIFLMFKSKNIAETFDKIKTSVQNLVIVLKNGATAGQLLQSSLSWIGLILTGISLVTSAINGFNAAEEERISKANQAADAALNEVNSLQLLKDEYIAIVDSSENEAKKDEQLTAFKKKLVEQYGFEKEAVDKLNGSRQEGIDLLNQEMKISIDKGIADLGDDYKNAQSKIEKSSDDIKAHINGVGDYSQKEAVSDLSKVFENLGYSVSEAYNAMSGSYAKVSLDTNNLLDEQEKLSNSISELEKKAQSNIGLTYAEEIALESLQSRYDSNKKTLDKYQETYDKGNTLYAQSILLSNQASFANVKSKESFDEFKDSILEQAGASEGLKNALSDLVDDLFPQFNEKAQEATDSILLFDEANQNYIGTFKENIESIEELNKQIDSLQQAYETLNSALEQYNSTGQINLDTFQELMNLEPEYIALLFDESGNMLDLDYATRLVTEAKIEKMGIDKASSLINNAAKVYEEKGSLDSLIPTLQNSTSTTWDMVEANLAELESRGANTEALRGQINAIKQWTAAAKASVGSSGVSRRSSGSGSKSTKSTKDAWKEEFEAQYDALKHSLAMEEITEKEYTDRLEILYKKYFSNKTKYLDEYNKYEEEVYKNRKKLLEEEIDEMEKVLKKQRELAENKYENAIKVATNAIDEQIEALQKQKEVLEEKNDEEERAIELAKLQEALEKAKSQKTMRVFYADRGWVKLCPII